MREFYDHPAVKGKYASTPRDWKVLAGILREAGTFGLDTEFHGLDVRKQSCVGRATIHVWSVAVRTGRKSPLGFARARGWVLPREALDHPELRAVLEDPGITKCVHNQPVDDHAMHNHGVQLRGCLNTLDLARWSWPELVSEGGFGLKNLMYVKLHREPVCEYEDVVSDERTVQLEKVKVVKRTVCICGTEGCRARKPRPCPVCAADPEISCDTCGDIGEIRHDKSKVREEVPYVVEKQERFKHPLESIVPGHPRWDLLVKYAAEDAVAALEIAELAQEEEDPAPWPYGGKFTKRTGKYQITARTPRPGYSQAVSDQVVLMERTGFRVDTEYCTEMVRRAEEDEAKTLYWLRRWYRANLTDEDWLTYEDDDVNAIWSSPKQLGELFDYLDFPRSPVWKKGRVRDGDNKLDATALEWIAKEESGAKQLIGKLIRLKRIRSGKKYLLKLRDCGGFANPICGDASEVGGGRFGAKTGRLAIKGVVEAQQLPSNPALDLYQIRKAVVA